jgi:hypothetical protein
MKLKKKIKTKYISIKRLKTKLNIFPPKIKDIFEFFIIYGKSFSSKKKKNIFLKIKLNFSLIKNCFLFINFYNSKQIQENLKEITFR